MDQRKSSYLLAAALAAIALGPCIVEAGTIFVPNGSFEMPATEFAGPDMDAWQKSPAPMWYPPESPFPWDQLSGQFLNTSNGAADHIVNMDGQQGAFLFAVPELALFQDFNTISGSNGAPTHLLNAQYEAGKSYTLTVAALGGGGGMSNGVTLEISLYYRDASNSIITVGSTTITNSAELFPTNTYFTDFEVRVPAVQASDAWAGKRIGIQIASTVGFELQGGYWDLDNVRLTESVVPNYSFEEPATSFASPDTDGWQKAPEPFWWSPTNGPWDQVVGQFLNTPHDSPGHIENMEGDQAAFLFALPDVAVFQDYNSLSGTNTTPQHDFNAKFEVGKSYALTVGLLGGGGAMPEGTPFEISLYYLDDASNRVTVAATVITNSTDLFPTNTQFTDFQAQVPTVRTNDAWAGRNIGIKLASLADFLQQGGYWDVDNVRLTESVLPNHSFEFPPTPFAGPEMDGWEKAPAPVWYPPESPFPWDQLTGQFLNTSNGAPDHIENMEGRQAAFLFALPEVAIYQDYTTLSGTNTMPSHDFAAVYEPGKSYTLTVGVLGGGGGMSNGVTLELSLYYRDASSNRVTIAATTITNSALVFPTNTHFVDFGLVVPPLRGDEPWAGRHIGVKLASTVGFDLQGGYWDVDNVRLRAVQDPLLKDAQASGGSFSFKLASAPGRLEILSSTNAALPASAWTSLGEVTNVSGTLPFTDPGAVSGQRFYQVRQVP